MRVLDGRDAATHRGCGAAVRHSGWSARTTEVPGSGLDLSAAGGPITRTPAVPAPNLFTGLYSIKRPQPRS
ncbi:hypothetical protein GCM10028790_06260 [Micromonospora taraxaci]